MASSQRNRSEYPRARSFEKRAEALLRRAESRGEQVYGIKPWYCSARIIENGANVAFIGANPGGTEQSQLDDEKLGILNRPYEDSEYNAWLDDKHWEGGNDLQSRIIEALGMLLRSGKRNVLRQSACLNVVPLRTTGTDKISRATWDEGVGWALEVLEHVAPEVIVCNGNGSGKSPWGMFNSGPSVITQVTETLIYGTFYLKRGLVSGGKLSGAIVIGLPHLSRMRSMPRLGEAASKLGFPIQVNPM